MSPEVAALGYVESGSSGQALIAAFRDGLQKLGWTEGRNTRIDIRWATPDVPESIRRFAKELVALQPDLIISGTTPITAALLQQARTIPIMFPGFPILSAAASSRASRDLAGRPGSRYWREQKAAYEALRCARYLTSAKALGLTVAPLLGRADGVIE
jgi:hypothetical protein